MAKTRWLDDEEMRAWRAFVVASVRVFEQLDRELKSEDGFSHDDYAILVNLSEAPGQRLRMTELADRVLESKSRLSHHVGRLEADGLVERQSCPSDRRGMEAVLTAAGQRRLDHVAPHHLRSVRHHFIDRLDRDQLGSLSDALEAVIDPLGGAGTGDCGGVSERGVERSHGRSPPVR